MQDNQLQDNQQIFNKIVEGIFKQGGPSTHNNMCLYRNVWTSPVRKCSAGWVLPDEEYNISFELLCVDEIDWFYDNVDIEIMIKLQDIHDDAADCCNDNDAIFLKMFKSEMINFAISEKLSIEIFDKLEWW